jgi:hypothetical protein
MSEKEVDQSHLDDGERALLRAEQERDQEQNDADNDVAPSAMGDDEES